MYNYIYMYILCRCFCVVNAAYSLAATLFQHKLIDTSTNMFPNISIMPGLDYWPAVKDTPWSMDAPITFFARI